MHSHVYPWNNPVSMFAVWVWEEDGSNASKRWMFCFSRTFTRYHFFQVKAIPGNVGLGSFHILPIWHLHGLNIHPCACFHFVSFIIVLGDLGGVVWFRKQTPNLLIWFMVNDSNRSTDVLKDSMLHAWLYLGQWCDAVRNYQQPNIFRCFWPESTKLGEVHQPIICGCPIQFGKRKCPEY